MYYKFNFSPNTIVDKGLYLYQSEVPVTELEGLNPFLSDINHRLSPET